MVNREWSRRKFAQGGNSDAVRTGQAADAVRTGQAADALRTGEARLQLNCGLWQVDPADDDETRSVDSANNSPGGQQAHN